MGKARSFRLSDQSQKNLTFLKEHWGLDNENLTMNKALEEIWEILRNKPLNDALNNFLNEFNKRFKNHKSSS